MSIYAHRITNNRIKSESSSFDIGHNFKFREFLDNEIQFYMCLNSFGIGVVDIPLELLEKAINLSNKLELDDDTISCLKIDVASAKLSKDEVVTYYLT